MYHNLVGHDFEQAFVQIFYNPVGKYLLIVNNKDTITNPVVAHRNRSSVSISQYPTNQTVKLRFNILLTR